MKYQNELIKLSENGYVIFRNVLSPQKVSEFHLFAENWLTKYLARFMAQRSIQDLAEFISIANNLSGNDNEVKQLSEEELKTYSGGFPLEFRLSRELREFICSSEILEVVQAILDSDEVAAHMPPMIRFIHPGSTSARVPAHIDTQYNDYLREFYTVWIPLQDVNEQIGGVNIFCDEKGRGNRIALHNSDDIENHFWLNETSPEDGFTSTFQVLNAGDILIFDKNVLHESAGNSSDKIRFSVDMRIFESQRDTKKHKIILSENKVVEPAEILIAQ